jgi:hypothetical protein
MMLSTWNFDGKAVSAEEGPMCKDGILTDYVALSNSVRHSHAIGRSAGCEAVADIQR